MKRLFFLVIVGLLMSGCIRTYHGKEADTEHEATLAVIETSDGTVSLSWSSREGYVYRLYYKDDNHFWVREDRFPDYPGTGEVITISKQLKRGTKIPLYSVRGIKVPKK